MATNPPFMSGVPELLILSLLKAREEMYGYEIVAAIGATTGGVVTLKEGVVYPLLHTLEADGLLKTQRPGRRPHAGLLCAHRQRHPQTVRPDRRVAAAG